MEIKLQESLREIITEIPEQRRRLPVSLEAVVPDSMEDLSRVALVRPAVWLKSKEPTARGLLVQGELRAVVLGLGESGKLNAVSLSRPFEIEFEPGESVPENRSQVQLTIGSMEARLVNPRKISALFEITAVLYAWKPESMVYDAKAEENRGLHLRVEDRTTPMAVASGEKSFVLSQQLPLPERPGELLYAQTALTVEDVSPLGSRAIVKGQCRIELGFETDGNPGFRTLSVPYSQILELPVEDAEQFLITPAVCSCYTELSDTIAGDRVLETEVHGLLQMTAYSSQRLCLPVDAYSNLAPLDVQRQEITVGCRTPRESITAIAEGAPELPEDWTSPEALLPGPVQTERNGEVLRLTAPVDLIYRTKTGELAVIRRSVTGQSTLTKGDEVLSISPGDPELTANALRLPMTVCLCAAAEERLERVTGLELDSEAPFDQAKLPAAVLAARGDGDLWTLARRWHSTVEAIEEQNREAGPEDLLLIIRERF